MDTVEHPWNISKIAECGTGEGRGVRWEIFPNFPHFGWARGKSSSDEKARAGQNRGANNGYKRGINRQKQYKQKR